ncbi:MAG: prolyl oligopeptidase family serine peptidase [Chloroflexi bacterium]|nr:prolyl oligopeptidase family serine peptidase [Chloroflexota bacterium]
MKNIQWSRFLKLTIFGLLAALLLLDIGAAWVYAYALTHPGCQAPSPLPGDLPAPTVIQLSTHDDLSIEAWYYASQNGAAVLALGGMNGSLGDQLPIVAPLLLEGYGVLQIEGRGCADPPGVVTLGFEEAYDVTAGLQYLLQQEEVNANRIGIIGFSMGGVAAIRSAVRNTEISAVLAEGGYANLGIDLVESDDVTSTGFFESIFLHSVALMFWLQTGVNPWDSSPVDEIALISPRPLFLIYGEYEAANGRARLQFEAALEPKTLWIVPGGDHGSNYLVAQQEYEQSVVIFFNQALLGE